MIDRAALAADDRIDPAIEQAAQLEAIFERGRERLHKSGLSVSVEPMREDESGFPRDVLCSRSRPRRTPFGLWRSFYVAKADATLADSRVLIASTTYDTARVALGFVALNKAGAVRMLYVKLQFRGLGIGLRLLQDADVSAPVVVTDAESGWKRWAACYGLPWVER